MFLDKILGLDMPREAIVVFIATLPIFELRGSLPVAINIFHFPWYWALILSVAGNMLPVPFLLLFFNTISKLVYRSSFLKKPMDWLNSRVEKNCETIEKYGVIGLLVFVAVPVPFTGAWTASLVAAVLRMRFFPSFMSILGGVVVAGVIVLALSLMGWTGALIAGLGLVVVIFLGMKQAGSFKPKNC